MYYEVSLYLWFLSLRNACREFIFSKSSGTTAFQFAKAYHVLSLHFDYLTGSIKPSNKYSYKHMSYNKLLLWKSYSVNLARTPVENSFLAELQTYSLQLC